MQQVPLFQPVSTWKAPNLSELPSWKDAGRVCIDIETCDPLLTKLGPGVRRGGYIAGYSFAIEDGPAYYVPLRHQGGDNIEDPKQGIDYLIQQTKDFKGDLCGANMQYDLDFLAQVGVKFKNVAWFRDCQVAEALVNELHDSYSLQNCGLRRGLGGKMEEELRDAAEAWKINPKKEMYKLPARHVGKYAIHDAVLPLQILRAAEKDITEQKLQEVYDLESKVLPILMKMRRRGVRIDFDKLDQVEKWSIKEEKLTLDKLEAETGVRIAVNDINKPDGPAEALQHIGITVPKTAKTKKPSISKEFLDEIDHPVGELIRRARKVNKLRNTFVKSIRNHAIGDRVHCSFNQLRTTPDDDQLDKDGKSKNSKGARYGRLSSCDPNLQQQPARDDFAKMWRSIYIPDEGGLWACCDYSQQEPRMLVHFAEMTRCKGAAKAAEIYRTDPLADNHTMMARLIYGYGPNEEPTKQHRTYAKEIFLGLCYSMGGAKLAHQLKMPSKWIVTKSGHHMEVAGDQAQEILDQFNEQVPFVEQMATKCKESAAKHGYIKTISGRRCRFPLHISGNTYDWCHKALNRLIQGSSADQTKYAMVAADAAGFNLQLQVHDEFDQTVESRRHGEALGKIMRECCTLRVPSKVDVEIGPNWGEVA